MELYLLRHGAAEDGSSHTPDEERALTAEGRRKLRTVLEAAAKAGTNPTLLLSSPLKRAIQTAELAKNMLKYKGDVLQSKALVPGSTVEQVWEEIRGHRDEQSLLMVGHNPLFSELSGYLLGSNEIEVDFKKGAILRVDFERFPSKPKGTLRWYLTPKLAESR